MLVKHGKLLLIFDRVTEESLGREAAKLMQGGEFHFHRLVEMLKYQLWNREDIPLYSC